MSAVGQPRERLDRQLYRLLEDRLTVREFEELQAQMKADPAVLEYVLDYLILWSGLHQSRYLTNIHSLEAELPAALQDCDLPTFRDYWMFQVEEDLERMDATHEDQPLVVLRPKASTQRPVRPKEPHLKRSLVNLAALFLFVVSLLILDRMVTRPRIPPVVAQVVESHELKWSDPSLLHEPGTLLRAGWIQQEAGLVRLRLKKGAELLLQAPCTLKLIGDNEVYLTDGSLTATVPPEAVGFRVSTLNADLIDYGTEFGIFASRDGDVETHVFEGEVELRSLKDRSVRTRLKKGHAGLLDRLSGSLKTHRLTEKNARFVRRIDRDHRIGRPGRLLSLADVVGGGNGYGTGRINQGLDPISGMSHSYRRGQTLQATSSRFRKVLGAKYIDGVFIPDGARGPVEISSTGLIFDDCPETGSWYYVGIYNGAQMSYAEDDPRLEENPQYHQALLDKREYGTPWNPALSLLPNQGITFDLDAIRADMSNVDLSAFRSGFGLSETIPEEETPSLYVWVLIDGKVVFRQECRFPDNRSTRILIPLRVTDRFLTLITTAEVTGYCWALFTDPVLELTRD